MTWREPLAFLSPLLIAYAVSLLAAVWSVLAKRIWPDSQGYRAVSRRDVLESEQTRDEIWQACLHEGFFMGNVAFSIWALALPLEGQAYKPEVQAGAIVLLILSCALFPFIRWWSGRAKLCALGSLVALALYVLLRQRFG